MNIAVNQILDVFDFRMTGTTEHVLSIANCCFENICCYLYDRLLTIVDTVFYDDALYQVAKFCQEQVQLSMKSKR